MKSDNERSRRWHAMKVLWRLCVGVPILGMALQTKADEINVTVTGTVAPYQFDSSLGYQIAPVIDQAASLARPVPIYLAIPLRSYGT
jgi:hypothetical protein